MRGGNHDNNFSMIALIIILTTVLTEQKTERYLIRN
jgi:hypothetical protein